MQVAERVSVILANGAVPQHERPLRVLREAERVICCDGAADKLVATTGREPDWIVGDMDSISDAMRERYQERLVPSSDQECNDLTKAFNFCLAQGWRDLMILGATGGREDHTLGNLSLLIDFERRAHVRLLSDSGIFTPLLCGQRLYTKVGQQLSFFAVGGSVRLWVRGVRYPVEGLMLESWWVATLNEAVKTIIDIRFEGDALLVFQSYV